LVPTHATETTYHTLTVYQFVVQPLVIPLTMIVGDELRDDPSVMAFAELTECTQQCPRTHDDSVRDW